jgi:hypothetical protein
MKFSHGLIQRVLNRGGRGVHNPLDRVRKGISADSLEIIRTVGFRRHIAAMGWNSLHGRPFRPRQGSGAFTPGPPRRGPTRVSLSSSRAANH